MLNEVYINRLFKFLPNKPVANDEMENFLGKIDGKPSKAKPIILRNNQIKTRYYALDENGNPTHNNAQMTAEAIKGLTDESFSINDIELLACGTTSPDQLLPSHTSMVHGELKCKPIEILSPSGSCCSGMHAMKYAYLSILSGDKNNAICAGSENFSGWMKSKNFKKESDRLQELMDDPIIAFEKDFLRWMLSDGAGSALLTNKANDSGISLKIDWIESVSYANELETCMYAGGEKTGHWEFKGWKEFEQEELLDRSVFTLRQDVTLLGDNIVPSGGRFLKEIIERRNVDLDNVNYFLPHLSSEYFRPKIAEELEKIGLDIPAEKWFTNLTKLGNVGAASIFFMLEDLFNSGRLKPGDQILSMVPESARFSYVYALMTVV